MSFFIRLCKCFFATCSFILHIGFAQQKFKVGAYVYDPEDEETRMNKGRVNWYGRIQDWKDILGFREAQDV